MRWPGALQPNTSRGVPTPAGWQPRDSMIPPPPVTVDTAEERSKGTDVEMTGWYVVKQAV
ncbi:MAG: hypothetical protein U0587_14310 [Candidatus Binatia bacterium]